MALRLLNWDQLPAGKFSSGGEVSAVAPHHLGAKRSCLTSSPKSKMGLMNSQSQSSLPLNAVLAMCSVHGTGGALGRGTWSCAQQWHVWSWVFRNRVLFVHGAPLPCIPSWVMALQPPAPAPTLICCSTVPSQLHQLFPSPPSAVPHYQSSTHTTHWLCGAASH